MQIYERAGEIKNFFAFWGGFSKGSYISEGVKEYASWLALQMSYSQASAVLTRSVGTKVVSGANIRHLVLEKAEQVSAAQQQAVQHSQEQGSVKVARQVQLYSARKGEVLLFEDGILVKGQKYYRSSKNRAAPSNEGHKTRPATDIALCPNKDGSSSFVIGGLAEKGVTLPEAVRSHMLEQFGQQRSVLKLVSITDGASQIRTHYKAAFGVEPVHILDWYHLKKKVNELCILICTGKQQRQTAVKAILQHLWKGKLQPAIDYLQQEVSVRNPTKLNELINYLNKHATAIIDYQTRKQLGKVIGSGCMEAGVKLAIAVRQKANGMAWTPNGSKALAILTVHYMNGTWNDLWGGTPFNAST